MTAQTGLQASDVLHRAPGVSGRIIDGEAVLVHRTQGKVRVLNSVGARIWDLANGERSVAGMAEVIASEYDVDVARAGADTLQFCAELIERGLLTLNR